MSDDMGAMVKTIIQAQVIQALNSAPDAIEALVKSALHQKVDDNGQIARYSSDNKLPYLDWLVGHSIRNAVSHAVGEVIRERTPEITELVRQGLAAESVVSAVAKAITKSAEMDWKIDVRFEVEKDRR